MVLKFLLASLTCLTPAASAKVMSFHAGFGPSYSDFRIYQDPVRGSAIERGPGYFIDARIRFATGGSEGSPLEGGGSDDVMGVDLFGIFQHQYLNDITAYVNDRTIQVSWGGGVDVFYRFIYFGFMYQRTYASLNRPNSRVGSLDIYYNPIGGRLGLRVPLNGFLTTTLGAQYRIGTATPSDPRNKSLRQNARINELDFMLGLQFQIFGI